MSLNPPETSLTFLAENAVTSKGKYPAHQGRNTTLGGWVVSRLDCLDQRCVKVGLFRPASRPCSMGSLRATPDSPTAWAAAARSVCDPRLKHDVLLFNPPDPLREPLYDAVTGFGAGSSRFRHGSLRFRPRAMRFQPGSSGFGRGAMRFRPGSSEFGSGSRGFRRGSSGGRSGSRGFPGGALSFRPGSRGFQAVHACYLECMLSCFWTC